MPQGYAAMLRVFLISLMDWLASRKVPIEERVWGEAVRACRPDSAAEVVQSRIMLLLQEVKVPSIMLLGESMQQPSRFHTHAVKLRIAVHSRAASMCSCVLLPCILA